MKGIVTALFWWKDVINQILEQKELLLLGRAVEYATPGPVWPLIINKPKVAAIAQRAVELW